MLKIFTFLIFLPALCFTQENRPTPVLGTIQIDSIAANNGNSLHDAAGRITIKKNKKEIAAGGFTFSMFFYNPVKNFNKLTREEKKHYTIDEISKLIKAAYKEYLVYKDNHTEDIFAEFYYQDKVLFFVRVSRTIQKKDKPSIYTYEVNIKNDIVDETVDGFDFDMKEWIEQKNTELLEYL
jgi:hypothetical protein